MSSKLVVEPIVSAIVAAQGSVSNFMFMQLGHSESRTAYQRLCILQRYSSKDEGLDRRVSYIR